MQEFPSLCLERDSCPTAASNTQSTTCKRHDNPQHSRPIRHPVPSAWNLTCRWWERPHDFADSSTQGSECSQLCSQYLYSWFADHRDTSHRRFAVFETMH